MFHALYQLIALFFFGFAVHQVQAADNFADKILHNGKIITVDQQFRIFQAIAIKGQRILQVGKNSEIELLKGPQTEVIDLKKKTVIPGLIDNHAHFIRAPEHDELRFDGITKRQDAIRMLTQRVNAAKPGEWIVTLGGWSEDQFIDDQRGFTKAELDRIAPNNPVVIQAIYLRSYLNTAAMKAIPIDATTQDPPGGRIIKGSDGLPSGVVQGPGGVAFVAAQIPLPDKEGWKNNILKLISQINAMGITAWYDAGGRGIDERHYSAFQDLDNQQLLNARAFWTTIRQPRSPQAVDGVLLEIAKHKPFQGSDYFENIGWGETVYAPATTNLIRSDFRVREEDMVQVRRIAQAVADQGMFLNAHTEMENSTDGFLTQYEAVNQIKPIKGLRWVFSHLDQVTPAQLLRMQKLNMFAGLHTRPLIQGAEMHRIHGDKAWDMPPFRRVQQSGVVWGLGSDATAVTTSNPFYSLDFAVTGRMVGGRRVNRQTVTREEALIAHTRSNAAFIFQENNLGSLQAGKYADLLILDRDYLTIPANQIKDIVPLATMVGGKFVHNK
jgi:predicted amidohydrolase YtcJ